MSNVVEGGYGWDNIRMRIMHLLFHGPVEISTTFSVRAMGMMGLVMSSAVGCRGYPRERIGMWSSLDRYIFAMMAWMMPVIEMRMMSYVWAFPQ